MSFRGDGAGVLAVNVVDTVIAIDAGGSQCTAVACTIDGVERGRWTAGGANPTLHGHAGALGQIRGCLEAAVAAIGPSRVIALTAGIAGATDEADVLLRGLAAMSVDLGLHCPWTMVSDAEVAFAAAGHARGHGVLVLAGTGAVVGEVINGRLVRHVDGHGWLLGDDGSGYWLGREAVRAALADLDGRGATTSLTTAVAAALATNPTRAGLLTAVYGAHPAGLARLAPLVTAAAMERDQVAGRLVRQAADFLLDAVAALRPQEAGHHIAVLAGGVLRPAEPVQSMVRAGLSERFGLNAVVATDSASGAAAVALAAALDRVLPARPAATF